MSFNQYISSIIVAILSFLFVLGLLSFNRKETLSLEKNIPIVRVSKDSLTCKVSKTTLGYLALEKNDPRLKTHTVIIASAPMITECQFNSVIYPNFLIWSLLLSMSIGLSFGIIPFLIYLLKAIFNKSTRRDVWTLSFISLVLVFLVYMVSSVAGRDYVLTALDILNITGILLHNPERIFPILIGLLFIPCLICLTGNLLIIKRVILKINQLTVTEIINLHQLFSYMLVITSVSLVLGVITTGMLRLSVLEVLPNNGAFLFPPQFLVAYGLVFTFSLVLFYLPGEFVFEAAAKRKLISLSDEESEKVMNKLNKQSLFKLGVSVLAPTIFGIAIEFLKTM